MSGVTTALATYNLAAPTVSDGKDVALQADVNGKLKVAASQLPAALGQTTMAASLPVTIASDQSSVPVTAVTASGVGAAPTAWVATTDRAFSALFTTCTRPANTTQYGVNDSISNNGTAGSVTALSATVSDLNDAPIMLLGVEVDTNDTAIGAATTTIKCYVYNSDPTANSGVGGGDNAAFSNKRAGLIGTFSGTFTAMSDGGKAFCAPAVTGGYPCVPTSGAKTLFIQFQITAGTPTPSANSTTLIAKAIGYQLRV